MSVVFQKRIELALQRAGKIGMLPSALAAACKIKKGEKPRYLESLESSIREGKAINRKGKLFSAQALGFSPAVLTGLQRTFGFARVEDDERGDVFIPGGKLLGAVEGDMVLLEAKDLADGRREGRVVKILVPNDKPMSGIIKKLEDGFYFCPDQMDCYDWKVARTTSALREGDKALAVLFSRSDNHRYHQVEVYKDLGSAESADVCAQAVLEAAGIQREFPYGVMDEAKYLGHRGIRPEDCFGREDLRDELIFTIDGADSKDLDDAVSLKKTEKGYLLGVHIADVSHYVRKGSLLNEEAFRRGTSVYYADQVIPMLPRELSNGICSLNPREDRLAFSVFLTLSPKGERQGVCLRKTVIRSAVKGVYSEVNALFDGTAGEELREKYREVLPALLLMRQLKEILAKNRRERGAPDLSSVESKFLFDKDRNIVDILPRQSGEAENLIEEFMITANEAVAAFAREKGLPFVYRIHEKPEGNKLEELKAALEALGIPSREIAFGGVTAKALSNLLEANRDHPAFFILNRQVLRSMSKARYSEKPLGNYGLTLADYCHFTSPIRRYPDLMIHRILGDYLSDPSDGKKLGRYRFQAEAAARQSSNTEVTAVQAERSCEDCYKAQYMKARLGEEFDGVISSVTSYGFFVLLPNTVEGLVRVETLPEGEYIFDGMFSLFGESGRKSYRCGDPVRVRCAAADISSGRVDLVLA